MRLATVTVWILGLLTAALAASQSDSGYVERQQRMTKLHVVELVQTWLEVTGVPGGTVAIVEGEHLLMLQGFGSTDASGQHAVDPDATLFRSGDLVRALTATLALQMAERETLDLDADVTGLTSLVDDALGPLTTRQLLLHTGGIDQRQIATRARVADDLLPLGRYLDRRMPARVRPPGVVSIPADHGYALIGRVLEQLAGDDFGPLLESSLLGPLGMTSTTVLPSTMPTATIATGHRFEGGRWVVAWPDFPQTTPASTLLTSAGDMATWMRTVLSDGALADRRILEPESVALLLERQFAQNDSLPGRTLAFREGRHLARSELYLTSTGNGFSSILVLLPERRVGLFAAFNGEIDLWDLVYRVLDPFDTPRRRQDRVTDHAPFRLDIEPGGNWQDAAVSQATAEKLLALVRQDRILRRADGALTWRARTFEPSGAECFEESTTGTRLCLGVSPGGRPFSVIGDLVLEKLAWYEARPIQISLWIAFTAVFLAAGWPRRTLPTRHSALLPDDRFAPRWPLTLARLAAALNFVFLAALAIALATLVRTDSSTLLFGVPLVVPILLSLPLVAAALTMAAATGLGGVWRARHASLAHRLRVTLLILALVLFLPFLWSWNLLGFYV